MATTAQTPQLPYGVITLDGKQYLERYQVFVMDVTIPVQNAAFVNQQFTLPGVAPFLLKGLTRDITEPGNPNSVDEIFLFRLQNGIGGLAIFDDRVVSNLCFGSAQFPFPLIPPVKIEATGSLIFDVIDLGFRAAPNYPYIVHLAFQGTYLFDYNGQGK